MNSKLFFIKQNIASFAVILGLLLMGVGYFASTRMSQQTPGLSPLARVVVNFTPVSIKKKQTPRYEELKKSTSISYLDSLEVGAEGLATLSFESNDRIRVLENSLITLDQEKDKIILIVKRGQIEIENVEIGSPLMISEAGSRKTVAAYLEQKSNALLQATSDKEGKNRVPTVTTSESQAQTGSSKLPALKVETIQEQLKQSKNNFFRCYSQLLQKSPGVAGHSVLTFTIDRNGKVSAPDVTTSTLKDTQFKKCLVESVSRVEFPAFDGEPITTTYPLRFE